MKKKLHYHIMKVVKVLMTASQTKKNLVEGVDVDAIAVVLTIVGVEAGVVFGKENPVDQKIGVELALRKEDEEPNKLVVVLVVEAVDDPPNSRVLVTESKLFYV
ncbi:hypothetical protein Peur_005725 [Populus x canadensis]